MKEFDVKFGIAVHTRHPPDQIMMYLNGLEEHFDSVWFPDHLILGRQPSHDILECLTTISYLSGVFRKFKFGSIVLCNSFRNPALVAKIGATLDALTGGRFILGIGAGWLEEEYKQYGFDFPPPAVRIKQMEEGVQIIKKMWVEEGVTFRGQYFNVENAYCNPKPDPPPPIMIGAGGERLSLKVVARHADWWNMYYADLDTYKHKLNVLKRHCSRIGRDSDEIVKTLLGIVVIADTEEEAMKIAKKVPRGNRAIRQGFVGTPAMVKDKICEFVDVGVEYFILGFMPFGLDGPILFSEEVIPQLLC